MRSNEHDTRSCVFAGFLDEAGQLWLNGRSRDTIRTGSETVHASEVERCLQLHPDVLVAAVVGLPHERLGQQVRTWWLQGWLLLDCCICIKCQD